MQYIKTYGCVKDADRIRRLFDSIGRRVTLALSIGLALSVVATKSRAATPASVDGLWESVEGLVAGAGNAQPRIEPDAFRLVALDQDVLAERLDATPLESSSAALHINSVITIPTPDGGFARFRIEESPVMAPELAAKFPGIKTYIGQGLDDLTASVRLDWTPSGFHAQILSAEGATYVDPYLDGDTRFYAVYFKRDYRRALNARSCSLVEGMPNQRQGAVAGGGSAGGTLRTYRLALAATGEYTQFHGGTVAAGLAGIVTTLNRVNGVYEREVAVRMVLVGNNDTLIFTNPDSDPYTNSNGFAMLTQNQATITSLIGSANYDIGHVFSTGGGGVAGLSVVCWDDGKAWGVTGQPSPIADPFDIDFVAHEMGHQFGGNHTFNGVNNSCNGNRNASTAYELGSGSTIMAYAGICGPDDLQPHSDPFFHFASFDEIRSFTTAGFGNTCPATVFTGNSAPTVNAGPDFTIPHSTPFALTATGSDPDNDELTYGWEEADRGPAAPLSAPDNGSIPLFRSFDPTLSPTRVFPRIQNILDDMSSDDEKLPQLGRAMDFRVTARDNRAGGGGVGTDQMRLTVDGNAGPFRITAPTLGIVPDAMQTVSWDVAGTSDIPISTFEVDIFLSIDGGNTFPFTLALGTPNDGSESVLMPDVVTASARIKVEAVGNVFFAINDRNLGSGSCVQAATPVVESLQTKNRFLSFAAGSPGTFVAVRVTLVDLPPPFDLFNGDTMWVGPPRDVSQNGASVDPIPGFNNLKAASLQCTPHFTDFFSLGTIDVFHEVIVPNGIFELQVVTETCDIGNEGSFSGAAQVTTSRLGDTIGNCSSNSVPCTPPDGSANINDVLAVLGAFTSVPNTITKPRADLEPSCPDLLINIADALLALTGFAGLNYPFNPSFTDPCDSPCGFPLR